MKLDKLLGVTLSGLVFVAGGYIFTLSMKETRKVILIIDHNLMFLGSYDQTNASPRNF